MSKSFAPGDYVMCYDWHNTYERRGLSKGKTYRVAERIAGRHEERIRLVGVADVKGLDPGFYTGRFIKVDPPDTFQAVLAVLDTI